MRIIPGLLVGYCIRGKKPLLIATLTAIAVGWPEPFKPAKTQ